MKLSAASLLLVSTHLTKTAQAWVPEDHNSWSNRIQGINPQLKNQLKKISPNLTSLTAPTPQTKKQTALDRINFEPTRELANINEFTVEGKVPSDLNGLYVRNGPNAKDSKNKHLFMGEGMVHGIWLKNGKAINYKNQYIDLTKNGNRPGLGNIGLTAFNSKLLSLGEIGPAFELNANNLNTIAKYNFDGKASPNISAHPKLDNDGRLHFFGYNLFNKPYLTYYSANPKGELDKIEPIALAAPKMIHDFMITENYVLFMDLPIVFKPYKIANMLARQLVGLPLKLPLEWEPKQMARFGVMPKNGSNADIQWFSIDPCFIFHTANAYEQGDEIVFDTIKYSQFDVQEQINLSEPAFLTRYTLNLKKNTIQKLSLDNNVVEFPQINPSKTGQPYRYLYCLLKQNESLTNEPDQKLGLIKYDLGTNQNKQITMQKHLIFGEFSFVAKETAKDEDDGYLMGYVFDKKTETSALWIYDAKTLNEIPLAKIHLGVRVPNGFHGTWVKNATYSSN